MNKIIKNNMYTQINTIKDNYIIQNLSEYALKIIISDAHPQPSAHEDLILSSGNGITNNHFIGICWGKSTNKNGSLVGIVE